MTGSPRSPGITRIIDQFLTELAIDDPKAAEEISKASRKEQFDAILRYEGIIGYTDRILKIVEEIWKIKLS